MKSLNKVQLIGNIGCQPQTHVFPDGNMVANFTLATTHHFTNKQEQRDREDRENQENQEDQENIGNRKEQKGKASQKKRRGGWEDDPEETEEAKGTEKAEEIEKIEEAKSIQKSKQPADWHNVVCYGRLAEIAAQYLQIGHKAYVEGYLRHRTFEDRDGRKRYITETVAKELIILNSLKMPQVVC